MTPAKLPTRWPWLFHLFRNYARRYAGKHFHGIRIANCCPPPTHWDGPAMIVMNHPSWWDPILAFNLSQLWPHRLDFAPIDAKALQQYKFLGKVGLFSVETGTFAGTRNFLQLATAIMQQDEASVWITAQGEFTDPRLRPVQLRTGVGHVAARMGHGIVLPLALEYPFWDQRTPEALVAFGEPLPIAQDAHRSPREWTAVITQALASTMDRLGLEAQSRNPNRFNEFVQGQAGVGGIYDWGRRLNSLVRGRRFSAEHSS